MNPQATPRRDKYQSALADLEKLRADGAITDERYAVHKAKLEAEAKRTGAPVWVILLGVVVAMVVVYLISSALNPDPKPSQQPVIAPPVVVYQVEGSASGADLTLETPTGTSQLTGKAVPLVTEDGGQGITIRSFKRGAFVYISAQNTGSTGDLTCSITVDGVVISENTAQGAYAIATCKGRA